MEGRRVFQRDPGESVRLSHPYRHPFSVAGSRFCSAEGSYLALPAVKREIRLDKIFTWLFQKPFSIAFLSC